MLTHRRERASGFIKEEITLLIANGVQDPRVQNVTVTDVDLTPDRRIARVYVSCYTGEKDLKEGLEGLESAKSYLRRELGQLLHWAFTPHLEFRVDRSWERGAKIDQLLNRLGEEEGIKAETDRDAEEPQ